jgi:hypothetical protein
MKHIIIIGTGWYGCHIATILKQYPNKFRITMIDSKNDIFDNSSYYNQNRLHYGYHYSRNYNTRELCKNNYTTFCNKYNFCIDYIKNNYYLISNNSIIDYKTYTHIYEHENYLFNIKPNTLFTNIDGDIINVNEHVINSDRIKNYFNASLNDINIIYNTKITKYIKQANNTINIYDSNGLSYNCDILLDCTYNQLGLSKKPYTYELTISLVFEQIKDTEFDAITIMDGKFSSLYPRDINNKLFTLTDVEYTPLISSTNYNDIEIFNVTDGLIDDIKTKMCDKFIIYYPEFLTYFKYNTYFLSKKTKVLSNSDSRNIVIDKIDDNVISVNCGKIYGIFEYEKYILEYLNTLEFI